MCGPLAVASTALTVGGMVQQNAAASAATKAQQNLINQQTGVSAKEFDYRTGVVDESNKKVNDIINEEFNTRFGNTQKTFDEQQQIYNDMKIGEALAESEYKAAAEAERTKQAGFRQQADTTVDETVGQMGYLPNEADRRESLGIRSGITDYAMRPTGLADIMLTTSDPVRAEAERLNAEATDKVKMDAARGALVASYGDAADKGNRRVLSMSEKLGLINNESENSMAVLPYTLGASALKFRNAGDIASSKGKISRNYADMVDEALKNYYSRSLNAQDDYTNRLVGSSDRYENVNRSMTDFAVQNTRGSSTLGDLMVGFGHAGLSAGMSGAGPTWKDVGGYATTAKNYFA